MKNFKLFFTLLLVFVLLNNAWAQIKRADSYFDNLQYAKAVPLYKRAVGKKHGAQAIEKLAESYRLIKKYELAAHYYSLLISKTEPKPVNYLHYGEVLMNINNYEEAVINLRKYNNLVPGDKKGIMLLKAAEGISKLIDQTPLFVVHRVSEVNSKYSDYAPVIHNQGLVYVSEREKDYVENLTDGYSNSPYSTVLISKLNAKKESKEYTSSKNFSFKLNSDYQNGPVSFNTEQDFIVFNKTEKELKGKGSVNRPKLYTATLIKNKWTNIKEFPFNSNDYSVGHPALTPDGKYLYFSSDMPGGFGGKDLYVSERSGENWSEPRNLGPVINTEMDECFPYVSTKGNFYFSSNGHQGFGGLDIFAAKGELTNWKDIQNLSAPLNSSYDDISIVFNTDESEGYFSSNRPGGKGADDIFQFRNARHWNAIEGKLLLSENGDDTGANVKMLLMSENGFVIQTTTTEGNGSFNFRYLPPDEKFIVKIQEKDTRFNYGQKIYLADENNNIIKKTTVNEEDEFAFYNLPFDPYKLGDKIIDDSRINLVGSIVAGENPKTPLLNQKIILVDMDGIEKYSTYTDNKGNYKFLNLPPDHNLAFYLPETDTKLSPNTKVVITDKNGNPIKTIYTNKSGNFKYELLAADFFTLNTLEEKDLLIKSLLKGKVFSNEKTKAPVPGLNLSLVNLNGDVLFKSKTDIKGGFLFESTKEINNYTINIDEKDLHLRFKELFIADDYGNIIRKIVFKDGKFSFEILPSDAFVLKTILEEDKLVMKGMLFTDEKGTPSSGTKINLLNENGQVVQTAETDALGNFKFVNIPSDHNYIVSISQTDTKLNSKRLFLADSDGKIIQDEIVLDKGQFNFKILPSEFASLSGLKENDTSFKMELKGMFISDKENKTPVVDLVVMLLNEQGKKMQESTTNTSGTFKFTKLDPSVNYVIDLDQKDATIKHKVLYLTDQYGNIVKTITYSDDKFNFQLLPSDVARMGRVEEFDTALRIEIKGKIFQDENLKDGAAGVTVDLMNEKGELVQSATTDNSGNFKFTNLPPNNNYVVNINQGEDTKIKFNNLYLTDTKGKLLKSATAEKGKFNFTLLLNENNSLSAVSIEDTWVKIKELKENKTGKIVKIEYIQFNFDSYEILPDATNILNKAVRALQDNPGIYLNIAGHTDSRGSEKYNQWLSQKRAESAKKYITSQGIQSKRINTIGYGEKNLLNKCLEGISCSDSLHKLNRRTEFDVTLKY
ncbi:MAG: OmpA family protein [Bacteroidetes bacterium]|nr:OmpA family protein [Bacteroidota bacterium]HET6244409.1 SdrD B-like domain-containing protein [Bacteroidia bacterium]